MLPTSLNRCRRDSRGPRGFTLTELMIALLIMGLIMSVVYKVFSSQDRFFRNQEQVASMQENLRATMEYINQELSWLGYKVPGLAVVKAAPEEIIFQANIPNAGETIQYVRYVFNATTNSISRAAGAATTDITDASLAVMASDMEALAISYFNVLNGEVVTDAADPLCATGIPAAVCAPGTPGDDASLMMVQRVKARVTARTSRPDWQYTDPNGGANPNYRKRRAVLDLRARNIEDVTLQGGQIVPGACGRLEHTITPVTGGYLACRDKVSMQTIFRPDPANNTFDDNPSITVNALDMNGNTNTNPNRVTYVYAYGDDGTPFNIYDAADPFNVDNTIDTGQTRYIAAQELSGTYGGNKINIRFAYSDGLCTQTIYQGDETPLIAPSPASYFYTGGDYVSGGLSLGYTDNSGAPITPAATDKVAMCSSVGNERVLLGAQLNDDCANPITGETITWDDGGFGGSFVNVTDNGDGTYNATYIPPDTVASVAPVYTATLSALWGSFAPSVNVDFIAAEPHDIVIDSIEDVTQAGIFQFTSDVKPRATQLGGNSGNSFAIERVDGQEVRIRFHFEDACGNTVFTSPTINHSASVGNVSALTNHGDGTYSFVWESDIGCGLEKPNEAITISSPDIANPSTQNETVAFNLLTTRSSDPLSGPFVLMDKIPIDGTLQAGNTNDYVAVKASILQYDPVKQYCTNLLPGSMDPFTMQYTLTGDVGGNGSFSPLPPFDDDTETTTTDVTGVAQVNVYSGTADFDDTITVTAEADIEGATYSGSIALGLEETNHPQVKSGFYQSNMYTTRIGSDQTTTTFDPGDVLYLQIFDYDENENPNLQESIADPYDVKVTVRSELTGDEEEVGLTEEISGNSAKFRRALDTTFFPAVATTLEKGDGTLQVRDGDTVTMHYEDKDNPADADDWTIYTVGADSFRIFKVGPPDTEILPPAAPGQVPVAYGDKLRPELSLPFLAGDGSTATDTVRITVDSGADSDVLVLKENGDTGIMMPDDSLYAGKHFSVLQSDVGDAADVLATPTTPRYITLTYDVAGSYAMTRTVFMRDYDLPEVVITSPADTDTVSGQVTVLVDANDVGNATSWGGIGRVELYVNGRLVDSKIGADLTGTNTFIWTTAIGTTPYWLDGDHTLTAKAYDTSNNEATSDPVGVTVDNNLNPIWFNKPAFNSIWSGNMDVQVEVGNLAAESGTYQVFLYVNSALTTTFTDSGPATFDYTVDTTLLPEGAADVMAIIRDLESNEYQTTALDFFVDRTAPSIAIGSPFDQTWINRADFPLYLQAAISDPVAAPGDPNDVDDATVTATFSGACGSGALAMSEMPAGSDTYTLSWPLAACDGVEGVLSVNVQADDIASTANHASRVFSTGIDTKRPTVNTLDVIPMVNQPFTMGSLALDGFIRGDVTLQATVTDAYPSTGAFTAWFYNDPYTMAGPADGTQYLPIENFQSAASGSFTDLWPTGSYPTGIYLLAAGVVDAAGNSNSTSPSKVLYLDNTEPWINVPWINSMASTYEPLSASWVPLVHGLVNVTMSADDWGGFLRVIEHRFVNAGDDPSIPANVVNSVIYSFTANAKVRRYQKSYTINTCGVAAGAYDVYAYATDWAGNSMSWLGYQRFVVEDWTYLRPPSVVDPIVHFEESPAGSGNYRLVSEGRFQNCGGAVGGLNVDVNFYHWPWDGFSYPIVDIFYSTGTTNGVGDMQTLSAPMGSWTYTGTSLGAVEFVDPGSSEIYAVLHPMTLGTPQDYSPYGTYGPWYTEFQPFNQRRLLANVTYNLTPAVLPAYDLNLSGTVIFNSGYPAMGESVILQLNYNDPMAGWMWTQVSTTTDSTGKFTFSPPADIDITEWVNIDIRHPSAFWGDTWMGWISWDPVNGWQEDLS